MAILCNQKRLASDALCNTFAHAKSISFHISPFQQAPHTSHHHIHNRKFSCGWLHGHGSHVDQLISGSMETGSARDADFTQIFVCEFSVPFDSWRLKLSNMLLWFSSGIRFFCKDQHKYVSWVHNAHSQIDKTMQRQMAINFPERVFFDCDFNWTEWCLRHFVLTLKQFFNYLPCILPSSSVWFNRQRLCLHEILLPHLILIETLPNGLSSAAGD